MKNNKSVSIMHGLGNGDPKQNIIQKSYRLLNTTPDSLESKDALYVLRLNTIIQTLITEIEVKLSKKKSKKMDPSKAEPIDPKKQLEQIKLDLEESNQILAQYKKQKSELEQKRIRLLDSKYRFELSNEISQIQGVISNLSGYCAAQKEIKKRKEMNNANITPSPNISIKAVVKQAIVVNKVKQVLEQISPPSKAIVRQSTVIQQPILQIPINAKTKRVPTSQLIKPAPMDDLNVDTIEVIDTTELIEKNRELCEKLDICNQRNSRLKCKVGSLGMLNRNFKGKSANLEKRYEELRSYARENHICEQPGAEKKFKALNLQCVALEKEIALKKNMFDFKIADQKQLNEELHRVSIERSDSCVILEQEIQTIRMQIEEMKQIQSTLDMNYNMPPKNSLILSSRVLLFQGEHSQLQMINDKSLNQSL